MALIDKETIRKEIKRRIKIYGDSHAGDATQYDSRKVRALVGLLEFLDSLPEQPVVKQEQPMSPKDKFVFPDFLYARTVDNKTIDVSYVPQSLNAVEYVKSNSVKQPVEGLEDDKIVDYAHSKFYYDKDFDGYGHSKFRPVLTREDLISFARHFAEWQKSQMLIKSSKKEVDEFMSRCDRDVLDELNRWRFTMACQEFIEQGIFDYGCAKHFAEWGAEQKSIEIFKKQNCQGCGSQRCTGDGEWLEGCKAFQAWKAEHLKK